jgi:aerobic-type carbon monoxide dehydrogenase small subunit (CoxS/CutS family)
MNGKNDENIAEKVPTCSTADGIGRRDFLKGASAAVVVSTVPPSARPQVSPTTIADQEIAVPRTAIRIVVNGQEHRIDVEDRWTLNELLRDHLGLTGSKIGCNRGECGACTVLVDGKPTYSCSTLAAWMDGREVQTVEGLERDGELSPLQQAFIDCNGPQCGFCTPGQLMTATALLNDNASPSADEVRRALAGNLCRCSNYNAIVESVLTAAGSFQVSGVSGLSGFGANDGGGR